MGNADGIAMLARLADACAVVRAALTVDGVLGAVAEQALLLGSPAARHAWAAAMDGASVRAFQARVAADSPSKELDPALLVSSFARLSRNEPVIRHEGMIAAALFGASEVPGGIVVVSRPEADATFDVALAQLAVVAGLALDGVRLRQQLAATTDGREKLFGTVAHDLRNPLNTFTMSADLLRDDVANGRVEPARAISLLDRMDRATTRMQALIEDLVEASRLEARSIEVKLRKVPAAQLLRDAVSAGATTLADKRITLSCEAVDEDAAVMADRTRTLQLLSKVVAFAAKSTGEGGAIRFAMRREGPAVVITARAFSASGEPVATPEVARGGLALLLARGLVEVQGGTFRVDEGSAFAVTLGLPAAVK